MKQINGFLNKLPVQWKQIFLIILLWGYSIWIEWESFGNIYFSEWVWLASIILLCIIQRGLLKQITLSSVRWMALGVIFWSSWRFINYIFASRAGWIVSIVRFLTHPLEIIFDCEPFDSVVIVIIFVCIILSIVGAFWIFKRFKPIWLRKAKIYWVLLLMIILIITIYSTQPQFLKNCIGVGGFSDCLFCYFYENLGIIVSLWIIVIFLLWILIYSFQQARINGMQASLILVSMEPAWIAMFFNPTRIIGVPLHYIFRSLGKYEQYRIIVTSNMQLLNMIPLVVFFLIIPIGIILIKAEKFCHRWILTTSAIVFVIIDGIMLYVLYTVEPVFKYSLIDLIFFLLIPIQLWLPFVIFSSVNNKHEGN